jgi:hypothetical protein
MMLSEFSMSEKTNTRNFKASSRPRSDNLPEKVQAIWSTETNERHWLLAEWLLGKNPLICRFCCDWVWLSVIDQASSRNSRSLNMLTNRLVCPLRHSLLQRHTNHCRLPTSLAPWATSCDLNDEEKVEPWNNELKSVITKHVWYSWLWFLPSPNQ